MTRTVILADDTEDMRLLLRMGLSSAGWDVTFEAIDGVQARDAWRAAAGALDALVLDHNMPGLMGMDLAAEVRAEDAALPIVIVSAYLDDELRKRAESLGVTCVDKLDALRVGEYLPS